MSTFGGYVPEFPDIRVDYFRRIPDIRPPLACFLSHVHTDHLAGLENFKSPFLYCSAATRELLLRLERYPHRMNIAQGILVPHKQHYKHLQNLLKQIPLETPTRLELEPGNEIQVTLFDANHCTGAVMFLIEDDSKAILYTGDIRSEPWFVNSLVRNPFLIQYTSGLKRLDCIYLDTSNTGPTRFPTKAEGLKELLAKVLKYPSETVFHFTAWTFGYEEVWMALSRTLKSQIHVDSYKLKLYQSLRGESTDINNVQFPTNDGMVLAGYQCGNSNQIGCLTNDTSVRIHSCEKGLHCENVNQNTVYIRPIIARSRTGQELGEVGVGGGGGDLSRRPELELDDPYMIDELLGLFANTDELVMKDIKRMLLDGNRSSLKTLSLDDMGLDQNDFEMDELIEALTKAASNPDQSRGQDSRSAWDGLELPKIITFPYSRHSSYEELCHLVEIFDPKDIYPCTVNEKTWSNDISMETLFGGHCSATGFRHDEEMRERHRYRESQFDSPQTQTTEKTESFQMLPPTSPLQRFGIDYRQIGGRIQSESQPQDSLHPKSAANHHSKFSSPNVVAEDQISATPPREIIAPSPGSASQAIRRKAIEEAMAEGATKRARLRFDSIDEYSPLVMSSPPAGSAQMPDFSELAVSSQLADTVSTSIVDLDSQDEAIEGFWGSDDEANFREQTFWDRVDATHRCGMCGHEVWSRFGFCSNCDDGPQHIPYYELLGSDGIPEFIPNRGLELGELIGDALDCNSSAYDSQDKEDEFREDYEINSFIDDEEIPDNPEDVDAGSISDTEAEYKNQSLKLHAELDAIRKEKEALETRLKNAETETHESNSRFLEHLKGTLNQDVMN